MRDKFNIELDAYGITYTVYFEAMRIHELNNELCYCVSIPGYDDFVMVYDYKYDTGFYIQGAAPYFAKENMDILSDAIERNTQ